MTMSNGGREGGGHDGSPSESDPAATTMDEDISLAEFEGVTSALDELMSSATNAVAGSSESTGPLEASLAVGTTSGTEGMEENDGLADLDQAIDASFVPASEPAQPAPPANSRLSRATAPHGRRILMLAGAAAILMGLAGGLTFLGLFLNKDSSEATNDEPQVILVSGEVEGAGGVNVQAQAPSAMEAAGHSASPAGPGPVPQAQLPATPPPGTLITTAIAEQRQGIARCFQRHALAVEGTPELELELSLEADGSVTRSAVLPAVINDSALGRCLRRIVRNTTFPPLGQATTVSVPLQARFIR
jgi:hypothetical protein